MKKIGKILKKRGDWNFGKKVPNNFVPHITKSVPFYLQGHDVIKFASDFFLKNNSICYDIGCSTAELLIKLSNFSNKKVQFIGIDSEKAMVKFSKKLLKKIKIDSLKHEKVLFLFDEIEKEKMLEFQLASRNIKNVFVNSKKNLSFIQLLKMNKIVEFIPSVINDSSSVLT